MSVFLSSSFRTWLSYNTLIFDLCNRFEFINRLSLLTFIKSKRCILEVEHDQGGAEDSYSAWHFFCVRIIQQKVTSHPVRQRATSLPGAKVKIYGNRFFYSLSKMMIFCNRLHILSLFFVHPVKELSLFTSMDYSTV